MKKIAITIGVVLSLASGFAFGHGGGLDSNRCHTESRTGLYHCH